MKLSCGLISLAECSLADGCHAAWLRVLLVLRPWRSMRNCSAGKFRPSQKICWSKTSPHWNVCIGIDSTGLARFIRSEKLAELKHGRSAQKKLNHLSSFALSSFSPFPSVQTFRYSVHCCD